MPNKTISQLPAAASADPAAVVAADNALGSQTEKVTLAQIKAMGPAAHASSHSAAGLDPITPASIQAANALHAAQHFTGGADQILPASIGAAAASHTHTPAALTGGTASQFLRGDGTWAAPPSTQVAVFVSSGTWTKPTGARTVDVQLFGGGGGGGSGCAFATGVAGGGGGGGGAARSQVLLDANLLGATVPVTVGAGGVAGIAVVGTGNGFNATAGGDSFFGTSAAASLAFAQGGNGGLGGTAAGTSAGGVAGTIGVSPGSGGGSGSTTTTSASGAGSGRSATGGGGGGGISSTGTLMGIGQPGIPWVTYGQPGSLGGGGNGASVPSGLPLSGQGGAGGTGSTTNVGLPGGNGGQYGAGGGGGGAGRTGGGAGGAGAQGIVVVTTYF